MSNGSKTGKTATAAKKSPAQEHGSSARNLLGLMPYLGRYRPAIAWGMLALAVTSIIGNIIPLATGVMTDILAGSAHPFQTNTQAQALAGGWLSRSIPFYAPHSRHALGIYCLILLVCVLLKGLMSFTTRWVLIGVSRDIEFDLRADLLNRLLLMEPEFYVRNRTGELMSRATNDLNNIRMVLGPGIMYTGQTLVTMILAVMIMARLSPSLTLWVLLPVPFVFVAVRHFGKVIHDLYEQIQASLASLSAKVQENLSACRAVPGTIFLGGLVPLYTYLGLFVWPMIALGWVTNIFQRGAASMGRLNYILNAQPNIDDRNAIIPADKELQGEIEFLNLRFTI